MMYAINAPIWHFPKSASGKIIIVMDKQKSWECVTDYRERVVELFRRQRMSEQHDQRIMSRVFLGGLRPQILNILLENEYYFIFKSVTFHAEVLEMILLQNEYMEESVDELTSMMVDEVVSGGRGMGGGFAAAGGGGPEPVVVQDGELFFGEPNKKIDELYNAQYILVLYR